MRILPTLLLAALLALPLAGTGSAQPAPRTITVTGQATVHVVPDLATISLGVTTNGDTAAEAMDANTAALSAVIERLKAAGIADRDLQTSNLSLNPNWVSNSMGTGSEIKGYIAANMLTVRVRAMDTTGTVLDAAIADGANTLNALTFGLQDQRPQEDEARKQAVADALARARLLTEAAGVTLGPILSISESGGMEPFPQPMYRMAEQSAVPVAGGEVGVSAAVTIVFQIGE
jgi:uncharacterized protein YggE